MEFCVVAKFKFTLQCRPAALIASMTCCELDEVIVTAVDHVFCGMCQSFVALPVYFQHFMTQVRTFCTVCCGLWMRMPECVCMSDHQWYQILICLRLVRPVNANAGLCV